MARGLVVEKKIREIVKSKGFRCGREAIDGLNRRVEELIEKAIARARANKRKTLMPCITVAF